jgi:thioredoxin reductase (NADPH)
VGLRELRGSVMTKEIDLFDVVIIGGGPGGMTAGLYCGRGRARTLLINKGALGGMMLLTTRYENFPGYPGGIETFELSSRFERHMLEHGVQVKMDNVTALRHLDAGPLFEIAGEAATYYGKSVIVATGSTPKMLDCKGAKKLFGRGVSICAVCDGAFYKGKDVAVVGGGDSAVEEAVYLTKFASSVRIIHRRNELRACRNAQRDAFENPKVSFVWDSVVDEVKGEDRVTGVVVRNVKTGEVSDLDVAGVFVYIGASGNSDFIELDVNRNTDGYIKCTTFGETNIPGLFAVGDIRDEPFKQAIIAAGHGASSALMVEKYLKTIPKDVIEKFAAI